MSLILLSTFLSRQHSSQSTSFLHLILGNMVKRSPSVLSRENCRISKRLIYIVLQLEDSVEAIKAEPKERNQGADCNWMSGLSLLKHLILDFLFNLIFLKDLMTIF